MQRYEKISILQKIILNSLNKNNNFVWLTKYFS